MKVSDKFYHGLDIFFRRVCQGKYEAYVSLMAHDDGYIKCMKAWQRMSGRTTVEENALIYNEGKIPERYFEAFSKFEVKHFGQSLIKHAFKD